MSQHSLPGVALNIGLSSPSYFLKGESEGKLRPAGPIKNSSLFFELLPRLSSKDQGVAGLQFLSRNFNVVYQGAPGQIAKKRNVTDITSVYIGLLHLFNNKGMGMRFYWSSKVLFSKLREDITTIYNDTIPPNNYTIKSRNVFNENYRISLACGGVVEKDIYNSILSLRLHPEFVFSLPSNQSTVTNSINRFVISFGICYKVE